MARLITSGFEIYANSGFDLAVAGAPDGGLTGVDVTTATRVTTGQRSGNACLRIQATSVNAYAQWQLTGVFDRGYWLRTYLKIGTVPGVNCTIMNLGTGSNVVLGTNGTVWSDRNSGATSSALSDGNWHRIEFYVKPSATQANRAWELRVDGSSVASATAQTSETTIAGPISVGVFSNTSADIYLDDVALNDDQGSAQNTWPGDGYVICLKPTADNTRGSWTGGAGGTTSLFDALNNTPPIGATAPGTNLSQISANAVATTGKFDTQAYTRCRRWRIGHRGLLRRHRLHRRAGSDRHQIRDREHRHRSQQHPYDDDCEPGLRPRHRRRRSVARELALVDVPVHRLRVAADPVERRPAEHRDHHHQPGRGRLFPRPDRRAATRRRPRGDEETPCVVLTGGCVQGGAAVSRLGRSYPARTRIRHGAADAGPAPIAQPLVDTVTVADALTSQAAFARTIPDSVAVADAATVARDIAQAVADTVTVADAAALARDIAQTVADTVAVADLAVTAAGKGATVTDTVGLTDAVRFDQGLTIADTVALTDVVAQAEEIHISDTLALSDSASPSLGVGGTNLTQPVADTLAVADVVRFDRAATVADTVTVADQVASQAALQQTLADTVAAADTIATQAALSRTVTDTVALTDATTPVKTTGATDWAVPLADTVALTDAAAPTSVYARTLADAVTLADQLNAAAGITYAQPLADQVTLADQLAFAFARRLELADLLELLDEVSFVFEQPIPAGWIEHATIGGISRVIIRGIDQSGQGRIDRPAAAGSRGQAVAEVVTFVGYQPPQRFDNRAWTQVRVEEAAAQDGTFAALETIALTPVDTDPTQPAARSFTTELGTAIDYWYRVVFLDATGDVSQPTTPVQNVGGSTVTSDVYATSAELFRILKIRTPTVEQTAAAERALTAAAGEINAKLGRLDALTPWQLQLCAEVNLERAVEHWMQGESPFGLVGLDSPAGPTYLPRRSRALAKLLPAQQSFGVG